MNGGGDMRIAASIAGGLYDLGLLLFGLAVLWDLVSVKLWLARIRKRSGPSAVAAVSWIVYFLWIVIFRDLLADLRTGQRHPGVLTLRNLRDLALLTVFHLCCHGLLPFFYARRITGRHASS